MGSVEEAAADERAVLLVGRDEELGLLRRRWEQSKEGLGQVVLIIGEAGIGKSSLVQVLRAQVTQEGLPRITFRCSPYHTNSALYPTITHLHRLLRFEREDPPDVKLAKVERGLAAFEASGRGDLLAEAYRLQGELLLRQATPDATQAKACFQQALAIARRQQAKSWELRAAVSLSRLWQQQDKRDEAHALLTPIYEWFTEGFDTADLQEAKVLLEDLAT